jgi:hypothetical protein
MLEGKFREIWLDELRRIRLPSTRVNKGKKGRRRRSFPSPSLEWSQAGGYEMYRRKPSLGSSKPQRLASSNESGIVAPVPQLAQFKSTSSAGGLIMSHWTPLTIKDPEPQ